VTQLAETEMNGGKRQQHEYFASLKSFTTARIALGRNGTSVPLKESLGFKLAHANARDAVYSTLDIHNLLAHLRLLHLPVLLAQSKVQNRQEFLQRPDLGRQLDEVSFEQLKNYSSDNFDIAFIIGDGLSATAVNAHAFELLKLLVPKFTSAGMTIAPFIVAKNARVALGDGVGELMKARLTIVIIGERPGLSSPDSLSAYITYSPKIGTTDEARNCISNINGQGLGYEAASSKIFYLVQQAFQRKTTGVELKEEMGLLME
jgi:ethanolamine ammonia-lyase small subunit